MASPGTKTFHEVNDGLLRSRINPVPLLEFPPVLHNRQEQIGFGSAREGRADVEPAHSFDLGEIRAFVPVGHGFLARYRPALFGLHLLLALVHLPA